ncbi:VOC family protein [Actinocrispum sp. NPDC049592]|uniref:VOC family protein n=1 Tax=Actinocrispum sp. NPDC049592 TaxID=3154835 RepID=UPI003445C5F4
MSIRVSAIQLAVADMARSLAFYRRLGLDIPASADTEPHVHIELPGGIMMAWDTEETIRSFDPEWQRGTGHPVVLQVQVESRDEVDVVYKDMVAAGYTGHKEPWDAFWGMRYSKLRDPDGNDVDLCSPFD